MKSPGVDRCRPSVFPIPQVDIPVWDVNDSAGRSDSARWNVGDPDAGMDAMNERQSHANRRRRWWLRAWSEQQRQTGGRPPAAAIPPNSGKPCGAIPVSSDETHARNWATQFQIDCCISEQVALLLSHLDRGTRLRVPLVQPVFRVGTVGNCDLRLPAAEVRPRECLLIWCAGALIRVSLASQGTDSVEEVRTDSSWQWGRWQVTVAGLPPRSVSSSDPADTLEFRLESEVPSAPWITLIPDGLSFLGEHAGRLRVMSSPQPHGTGVVILRFPQRVWLVNPWLIDEVRVNGRVWPVCGLEPGDTVSVGQVSAQMTIQWTKAVATSPAPEATATRFMTTGSDWEQFLLDQSARLVQMQQSLEELSREPRTAVTISERRVLLGQIQELAAACARDAAIAQTLAAQPAAVGVRA